MQTTLFWLYARHLGSRGHAVAQSVEALHYKPEGRGSIHDAVNGIFHPLTEMNTRNTSPGDPPHVSIVLKSANLSLLEPAGPVNWLLLYG